MMACCDCKIPNILYFLNRKRVRKTEKNMVASINNVAAPAATKKTESEIRPHWIWNQTQRNIIEGLVPNHGNGKRGPSKQANKQINEQATKEIVFHTNPNSPPSVEVLLFVTIPGPKCFGVQVPKTKDFLMNVRYMFFNVYGILWKSHPCIRKTHVRNFPRPGLLEIC